MYTKLQTKHTNNAKKNIVFSNESQCESRHMSFINAILRFSRYNNQTKKLSWKQTKHLNKTNCRLNITFFFCSFHFPTDFISFFSFCFSHYVSSHYFCLMFKSLFCIYHYSSLTHVRFGFLFIFNTQHFPYEFKFLIKKKIKFSDWSEKIIR